MSTRSTVASCTEGRTNLHLYHEMHDDLIHLEISDEQGSYAYINIVIPQLHVAGLAQVIKRNDKG